jgi:hypothetical protein
VLDLVIMRLRLISILPNTSETIMAIWNLIFSEVCSEIS